MAANVTWARSLNKSQLGGVIFGCTNSTMNECLTSQLFGLPAKHFLYVKHIEPGLPLFLFNYSERKLHGIYEAASSGKMNIDSYAWTEGGLEKTKYPAQVQIRVRLKCQGLDEHQFKPIIADNYYSPNHFWFELDHAQASKLMSKLSSLAVGPGVLTPKKNQKWTAVMKRSPANYKREESGPSEPPSLTDDSINSHDSAGTSATSDDSQCLDGPKTKLSSLAVGPGTLTPNKAQKWKAVMKRSPADYEREESGPSMPPSLTDNSTKSHDPIGTSATSDDSQCLDGKNNQLNEASLCIQNNQIIQPDEKDLIYMKLKELALGREYSDTNITGDIVEVASIVNVDLEGEKHANATTTLGKWNDESTSSSLDYPSIISQLRGEMDDLKASKNQQALKMENLEKKLVEAEQEIYRLENRCMLFQSRCNPSATLASNEALIGSANSHLNLNESIFIVGGYDGDSCLSALHSFSPSHDVLRSHKPMSSARANASVARLDGELYVFGGRAGSVWYDTVESYNVVDNQWTVRPSLNEKKSCFAVAALNGKFYSVGGGNEVESFSDVEIFDPNVGRWIFGRSMLQKRFALAAVEFHGTLYAVGGYDGNNYLKSAERFDPREHSWTRISSMHTTRASHSLVVLNEKLYAIGGHDGTNMTPNVEIYEPRVGTWMTGEPMNQGRGYLAAAVLKESIYVIGGVKAGIDSVDTIECYKEGQGWQTTNLRAVGKRCYASAIVLGED